MQVDVPIQLPSQLEDEIRKTIASVIIEGAKQATNLYYDLPPYPNKSQLKKALGVGDDWPTWLLPQHFIEPSLCTPQV